MADTPTCPARPKRTHGMLRRLTMEERTLVRRLGKQMYHQQNRPRDDAPQTLEVVAEESQGTVNIEPSQAAPTHSTKTAYAAISTTTQLPLQTVLQEDSEADALSERTTTPAVSPTPSYIMVAIESLDDAHEPSPGTRPASPRKRPRRATIASP